MKTPRCPVRDLTVLAAFALLVAALPGSEAHAAATGVRLRYGLKPGSGYQQAATMALDMAVDPSSLPAGLAPLAQSMAAGMKQEIEFKGLLEVQEKATDGSTPFTFKVVEAHGSFTRGGEVKDVPSVSAVKDRPPLKGRFSADGRRVEMEPDTAAEPGGADRRRDQLAQALPELPEKEIQVGESFEARVPMRLPSGSGRSEAPLETRWVYTLRAVDGHRASFDVRQVIPDATTATLAKGRLLGMSGGATGTATFDMKEGMFSSIHLDAAIDLTYGVPMPPGLAVPGAAVATPPPQDGAAAAAPTPPVLTLKSKLTGPIRIEMGRNPAP